MLLCYYNIIMGLELKTILLAMTPINELRGTIPLAVTMFHFTPWKAMLLAYIGNMIPVFFLLWFWKYLSHVCMRKNKLINKLFLWLFNRTRQRFYKKYALYGNLALILFVAIPLPMTGAWTGTIAAFLFGISYRRSLGLIFLGVIIAGIVVTLITMGISSLVSFLPVI